MKNFAMISYEKLLTNFHPNNYTLNNFQSEGITR